MVKNFLTLVAVFCSNYVAVRANKWAFSAEFDKEPSSPSQKALPKNFDYEVTHRTHPQEHFTRDYGLFPGDHDRSCRGPDPSKNILPQHNIRTSHNSTGKKPDPAFYICNNHLMSAMGDVSPYSIASFWPKQEFDFRDGGTIQFEVNNNSLRRRHWIEVLIVPKRLLSVAAGPDFAPIEEHYPTERIVFRFMHGFREMQVGTKRQDPKGRVAFASEEDPYRGPWYDRYPNDPSMRDRRIRIKHKITFSATGKIVWFTESPSGGFEKLKMTVSGKMPFTKGIVMFKTHSYTPTKDGNYDDYTDHWDNIRFSGRTVGCYKNYEASDVIYMQRNGDGTVGDTSTTVIKIPSVGKNPVLFGQVHTPTKGEVLLSINGGQWFEVKPYSYSDGCSAPGWKSFQVKLNHKLLRKGANKFTWRVGSRSCPTGEWIGFSVKGLELHFNSKCK